MEIISIIIGTHGILKNQNLGAVLELPAKLTALPNQPIHSKNGPNGLNWQCSSKTTPGILTFSNAMGADYSIELISIETYAPQFIVHNRIFLGSVILDRTLRKFR